MKITRKKLSKKQKKIAQAAPPPDEITGADFKVLNKSVDEANDGDNKSASEHRLNAKELELAIDMGVYSLNADIDISKGLTVDELGELLAQGKLTIDMSKASSVLSDMNDDMEESAEDDIRQQGREDGKSEAEIEQDIQIYRDEAEARAIESDQEIDDIITDILDDDPSTEEKEQKQPRRTSKNDSKAKGRTRYVVSMSALRTDKDNPEEYLDSSKFKVEDTKLGKAYEFYAGQLPIMLGDIEVVDVREREGGSSNLEAVFRVGPHSINKEEFMLPMKSLAESISKITRRQLRSMIKEYAGNDQENKRELDAWKEAHPDSLITDFPYYSEEEWGKEYIASLEKMEESMIVTRRQLRQLIIETVENESTNLANAAIGAISSWQAAGKDVRERAKRAHETTTASKELNRMRQTGQSVSDKIANIFLEKVEDIKNRDKELFNHWKNIGKNTTATSI